MTYRCRNMSTNSNVTAVVCLLLLSFPVFVSSLYLNALYHITGTNVTQVISGFRLNSPMYRQGNVSFNVTAPLIPWFPSYSHSEFASCKLKNSPEERKRVQGKVLLITLPQPRCFFATIIEQCQQLTCAGVVIGDNADPAGANAWSIFKAGVDPKSLRAPLVEISASDVAKLEAVLQDLDGLQEILGANLTLLITITSGDTNAWGEVYESLFFTLLFRVTLPIFSLCCFYFAVRRYTGYLRAKGSKLALVCLLIEAITNLVRAVYCIIDPIFSQGILPWQVSRMLVGITVPWSLSTSLLIGLFWAESLDRVRAMDFLSRFKVHFIVLLVLFILLELFASVLSSFMLVFFRIPMIKAGAVLGVCMQLVVAFFFIVFGFKVLKMLSEDLEMIASDIERRRSRLKKMTRRILGSGIGMIMFASASVCLGTPLIQTPYGFVLLMFFMYSGLQITSVFQIFAFAKLSSGSVTVVPVTPRSNNYHHKPQFERKYYHRRLSSSQIK